MKSKSLLLIGLSAFFASTVLQAQEVQLNIPGKTDQAPAASAATPTAIAADAPQVSEDTIMETFGWFVTARLGISELRFTPEQIKAFARGAALAAAGKETPHDLAKVGPVMDKFIGDRQAVALERARQSNLIDGAKFFTALKKRPGILSTASGLCYEVLQPGTGPNVTGTDTVKINYTGMLLNGQVFDSSEEHGSPLTIDMADAMPGWAEGVQKVNKGGKIKLYIPSDLAYGDEGAGGIPPGSALIFEIEVLEINPPAAPAGK